MLTRGLVACIVVVLAGLVPGVGRASADTAFSCTPSSGTLGGLQVLRHVTATTEAGFDRVTFEFATLPAPAGVGATFTVSAATPPFTSGASGQPLAIGGLSFVKVAFHNGYLQDPVNATPTVSYAGPLDLKPGLPVLTEAAVSDASEGFLHLDPRPGPEGVLARDPVHRPRPADRRAAAAGAAGHGFPDPHPPARSGRLGGADRWSPPAPPTGRHGEGTFAIVR